MIIGHQKQWEFFVNKIKKERLSHAYLFCGQNQIGKKSFAIEVVKLINCLDKKSDKACEVCKNCIDIKKGNFPDFLFVRPGQESVDFESMFSYNSALPDLKSGEELINKKEIEISQARKITNFLNLKPYFNNYKAVVIDSVEKMTIQAQNCLLKTLEEPQGKTILFLITSQPDIILSTISSRCQIVKFFPVKKQEILNYFLSKGASLKKAGDIINVSNKKIGVAINFYNNSDILKNEKELLNNLLLVLGQNLSDKFAYTKNLKEEDANINKIIIILRDYFRYLLLQKISNIEENYLYESTPENIKRYSIEKIIKIIKIAESIILKLTKTNASSKLALEVLLLEID